MVRKVTDSKQTIGNWPYTGRQVGIRIECYSVYEVIGHRILGGKREGWRDFGVGGGTNTYVLLQEKKEDEGGSDKYYPVLTQDDSPHEEAQGHAGEGRESLEHNK